MRTPAARAVLVVLALVGAAAPAVAERVKPLPGSPGLVFKHDALRHPCTPGATFRSVKRVKGGDDPAFVKAMTLQPIHGLDFDPENPRRQQASMKKFQAWLETMTKRYAAARHAQEKVIHDAAASPEARVAAVARLVMLHDQAVMLVGAIGVPASVRKHPEAQEAFCDQLDTVAEPLRAQAAEGRTACTAFIARHRIAAGWWTDVCSSGTHP